MTDHCFSRISSVYEKAESPLLYNPPIPLFIVHLVFLYDLSSAFLIELPQPGANKNTHKKTNCTISGPNFAADSPVATIGHLRSKNTIKKEKNDRRRDRTCNLLIRSQAPCHWASRP